jgi:uncharacterized RDD family membrane protein YckC
MTKSFGNPGAKPDRPGGSPNEPENLRSPIPDEDVSGLPSRNTYKTPKPSAFSHSRGAAAVVELKHIDPRKRLVALVFDFIACYLGAIVIVVLPFINRFISLRTAVLLLFLVKDCLFQGRGIGKNLMGLQVVDVHTGAPCSLYQSIVRNIVLLLPFAVLEVLGLALSFISIDWLSNFVFNTLNVVGMLYVAIVLPTECYRAYSRQDSLRKGDELAGTAIVEAPMDFANPFSR